MRISDDSIRVSSRGGKVPNYIDDVDELAQFDDDGGEGYYAADGNGQQYEEEHEIEGVFYHGRDDGRENDPEDLWHDNIVRYILFTLAWQRLTYVMSALSYKMERIFALAQHRRKLRIPETVPWPEAG